jgi:1-acyl-sn-glycerol-3-phosphate acyltransferase
MRQLRGPEPLLPNRLMTGSLPRPTPDQLALLGRFERVAFAIADRVNRRPGLKRAAHAFLRTFGAGWVYACTRNLLHVYNLQSVAALRPDRGVVVVSNHRSFFDLYVIACVLLRNAGWIRRMYFPVRADYFYERPDGVVVNAIMSALAMYPPLLRQTHRRKFNRYAVDFISAALQEPGTLVGFHPEGTRNKTPDPYSLLPANPGIGQILHQSRPLVVPAFILGLSNNLPRQVAGNFNGSGEPITLVFGPPLDLQPFYDRPDGLHTYRDMAEHLRERLSALGQQEREVRRRERLPNKDTGLREVC